MSATATRRRVGLRPRAWILLVAAAFGAALGVGSASAAMALGGPLGIVTLLAIPGAAYLVLQQLLIRTFPQRFRRVSARLLDPDAEPPADAVPVAIPTLERYLAGGSANDFDALVRELAPDFEYRIPGRKPISRKRYLQTQRRCGRVLRAHPATLELAAAEPGTDTAWVRLRQRYEPRHGAGIDVTWLDRWTLTPDREQVRAIELIAFTRVD